MADVHFFFLQRASVILQIVGKMFDSVSYFFVCRLLQWVIKNPLESLKVLTDSKLLRSTLRDSNRFTERRFDSDFTYTSYTKHNYRVD